MDSTLTKEPINQADNVDWREGPSNGLDETAAIEPMADEDVYVFPASFAQQRLWFLDQFDPGSPLYNIFAAVQLEGALNVSALERALAEMVARHESLRTTFAVMEGEPVQVINPSLQVPLMRIDLQGEREDEAHRQANAEAQLPFDLTQGPLLRVKLLTLDSSDHVLLLTMHHIISDGWSIGIFIREVAALYAANAQGQPSPLPEMTLQYGDFAEWQQEWLRDDVLQAQIDYWKAQLGDNPSMLQLPTDRPRPAVQTTNGAKCALVFPAALSDGLKELSKAEGVTLFMTLLAGWQTLLYRYTNQHDISVGTTIANRTRRELEGVIGFFVNTLVMRTDLSGEPSFRALLQRVREVALGAYGHQDLPFEKLVEELNPPRNMSHTPLFQVMFTLQNAPTPTFDLVGLRLSAMNVDRGAAKFDLNLNILDMANGLVASLEYNTDLFNSSTIDRMLAHFQMLLTAIVAEPDQSVSALPMLQDEERQHLLVDRNGIDMVYAREQCLPQRF